MKKTIILLTMTSLMIGAARAQVNTGDETAVRNVITTLEKGWNSKSGETFSSAFAEVHDYIVVNGFYFPGFTRERNASTHQFLFNTRFKNTRLLLKIDKMQFLRPDLALTTVLGANYEGETIPQHPGVIMTILTEKKDGAWKIISFHNHSLLESFADQHPPMPPQVMYATWYKN